MSDVPKVPVRRRAGQYIVDRCPFCERRHKHGAAALGYRTSHCDDPQRAATYELVLADVSAA